MIAARFSGNRIRLIAHPDPQGAEMDDTNTGRKEQTGQQSTRDCRKDRRGIKSRILKILVLVVLLLAAALVAQGFGLVPPVVPLDALSLQSLRGIQERALFLFGVKQSTAAGELPGAVFSSTDSTDLLSNMKVLGTVGRSPVDPSRVLFAAFEKSVVPEGPDGVKACPPISELSPASDSETSTPVTSEPQAQSTQVASLPPAAVVSKAQKEEPADPPQQDPKQSKGASGEEVPDRRLNEAAGKTEGDAPTQAGTATKASAPRNDPVKIPKVTTREHEPETGRSEKNEPNGVSPQGALSASESEKRPEKYRLPGSLVINVEDYKGSLIKWGLMVILDDSRSMARNVKPWEPDRMNAAVDIVGKIPGILTPGSRLAVRDFYCGRQKGKKRSRVPLCLSHMLFSWGGPPFDGLQARLVAAAPGGRNNPCAAAAYALRKDFGGIGDVVPRLVIVSGGIGICNYRAVLHAVDQKGPRGRVRVDVVALGMSKRRERSYMALAKKSGGVFLRVEKPSEVRSVLAKYQEALKTPAMKKMQVIGEKSSFKVGNGEEITLAPGAYKIALPAMRGLPKDKLTIEGVKISSGENSILKVRIKQGRLLVKASKR